MKKALILRALALAAMMSPYGGEDIVGECTVEGCGFTIVKNFLNFYFILEYGGSGGKESACNAGDPGLIPGLGRSPGEGNGYPLQYSCLKNSMGKGAWWAAVHEVTKKSDMT